jgi:ABC-2 type transport system permease protein
MLIYTLVFSVIARLNVPNYAAFLLAVLLPWLWFQGSLGACASSVRGGAHLLKKVPFPAELLPAAAVATQGAHFLLALPLLLGFLLWSGASFGAPLGLLPLLLIIQAVLAVGLGLALAAANVFFRDVEFVLAPLLMVWMYATPVVYESSMVPARYQWLLILNPFAPLSNAYREVLWYGRWPDATSLVVAAAWAAAAWVVGGAIFRACKHRFAEEL